MKAIHPDNCMLWIQYQSPDLHLGPKFSYCFSPSPLSPFNSFALIIHRSGQLENKQLGNQRAVKFPCAEKLSESLPLPFQRPAAPVPPAASRHAAPLLFMASVQLQLLS